MHAGKSRAFALKPGCGVSKFSPPVDLPSCTRKLSSLRAGVPGASQHTHLYSLRTENDLPQRHFLCRRLRWFSHVQYPLTMALGRYVPYPSSGRPQPYNLTHLAWNTGTCLYMIWTGLACLNQFINSIVWNRNAINWSPTWCDICKITLILSFHLVLNVFASFEIYCWVRCCNPCCIPLHQSPPISHLFSEICDHYQGGEASRYYH